MLPVAFLNILSAHMNTHIVWQPLKAHSYLSLELLLCLCSATDCAFSLSAGLERYPQPERLLWFPFSSPLSYPHPVSHEIQVAW